MPDDTAQPSDTGKAGTSGIQIPKERFDEVSALAKAAATRAEAAERRFQESEAKRAAEHQADARRIEALERRFAPEPEVEYEDPAEKALKEIQALNRKLAERDEREAVQATYRADGAAIMTAIKKAGIQDTEKAAEALSTKYGASKHFGMEWDPEKAATAYRDDEKAADELRARAARDNANATQSAITGSGSAPAVATTPPPKRPSPAEDDYRTKYAAWERDMEARIIAETRAAG